MAARKPRVPPTTTPPKPTPALRVSQIVVNLVLLDAHDAPVQPDPLVFVGNDAGSAAENLTAWIAGLPAQLERAPAEETPEP